MLLSIRINIDNFLSQIPLNFPAIPTTNRFLNRNFSISSNPSTFSPILMFQLGHNPILRFFIPRIKIINLYTIVNDSIIFILCFIAIVYPIYFQIQFEVTFTLVQLCSSITICQYFTLVYCSNSLSYITTVYHTTID